MKRLLLTLILISAQIVMAAEFYTFTSKDGKTVKAKIIDVNSAETQIELERENGKTFWVSRNIFSIDDQTYIDNWIENPDGAAPPEEEADLEPDESFPVEVSFPLEKMDVKRVVKTYEEAWSKKNYDLYCRLCVNPVSESRFDSVAIKSLSITKYDGAAAELKFNLKYTGENWSFQLNRGSAKGLTTTYTGWVVLCPDGKVKYEPIFDETRHPMVQAIWDLYYLNPYSSKHSEYTEAEQRSDAISTLNNFKKWGIPTYDYDYEQSESKRKATFDKIYDWILENYETWDASEPQLPCPEDGFDEGLVWLKQWI